MIFTNTFLQYKKTKVDHGISKFAMICFFRDFYKLIEKKIKHQQRRFLQLLDFSLQLTIRFAVISNCYFDGKQKQAENKQRPSHD